PLLKAPRQFFLHPRSAVGITVSTFRCQPGTCANDSSTIQSKFISGMARAASESAGKVCTRSPMEESLTINTRMVRKLGGAFHEEFVGKKANCMRALRRLSNRPCDCRLP